MRRADRLFQIVQLLRGGRLVTARQLSERLEVSERTIYRDVADLIGSGVPVEGEAGVGYIMRSGFDLPPLMFTEDEIVALVAGARMIRAWGGAEMALAAEEALVKIGAVLPESGRARVDKVAVHAIEPTSLDDATRARLDRLEAAANSLTRLEFAYRDAEDQPSTRIVRPLGLWFWGQVWTLVAWCELRDDFRVFRVDRMEDVVEAGRFKPRPETALSRFFALKTCETERNFAAGRKTF